MRALAEKLGCGPMSLYSHVRDKAELLEAVGALALERMDVEIRDGGTWTEQLESWMHSLEQRLLEHPELGELIARQQNDSPALLRAIRAPIRVLLEQGFDRPAAVRAAQGMLWVAIGFFFIGSLPLRYPRDDSPADQLAAALAKTPEAERAEAELILPHLAAREGDSRDVYAAVVRRLIAGLASELEADR
jgi:AcrR family transcriptional regulator